MLKSSQEPRQYLLLSRSDQNLSLLKNVPLGVTMSAVAETTMEASDLHVLSDEVVENGVLTGTIDQKTPESIEIGNLVGVRATEEKGIRSLHVDLDENRPPAGRRYQLGEIFLAMDVMPHGSYAIEEMEEMVDMMTWGAGGAVEAVVTAEKTVESCAAAVKTIVIESAEARRLEGRLRSDRDVR